MENDSNCVERIVRAFSDCWNRHNIDGMVQLFAEDAEFVNAEFIEGIGLWWKGCDEIRGAHVSMHAPIFKYSRIMITKIVVRFIKPDVAIARSLWELSGQLGPSGEPLYEKKGILMNVVSLTSSGWKIIDTQMLRTPISFEVFSRRRRRPSGI
jgi:uncharacterized protein (TIGR02246 family)